MTQKVDLDSGDAHMVRPLHLAAITNHIDIVQQLIDRGANPTKQDEEGDVPLHWAATKGHVEVSNMRLWSADMYVCCVSLQLITAMPSDNQQLTLTLKPMIEFCQPLEYHSPSALQEGSHILSFE